MSNLRYTWIGWWLFVASAMLFGLSALRSRDWLSFTGASAFLLANISFMSALSRGDADRDPSR